VILIAKKSADKKSVKPMGKVETSVLGAGTVTGLSESRNDLEARILTPDELRLMSMEKLPCAYCKGHGEKPRYSKDQLDVLKQRGLPYCMYWEKHCSIESMVPRDICYKERDPRGRGCATANNFD